MSEMPGGGPHSHNPNHLSEEIQHLSHSSEISESLAKAVHHIDEATHDIEVKSAQQKKFIKTLKIEAFAIPIITILGVGLSIAASTYWNTEQQRVARVYHEASEIKEDIDTFFTTRNNLMDAIIQLRAVRDIGQTHCNNGKYVGTDAIAYQEKLYSAGFKLVNAGVNAEGIYGDEIDKKIMDFLYLVDVDRIGICDSNAPKDEDLRKEQRSINTLILKEINDMREKRGNLLKSLKG